MLSHFKHTIKVFFLTQSFFRFLPHLLVPIITLEEDPPLPKIRGRPPKNHPHQQPKIRIKPEFRAIRFKEDEERMYTCHLCKDNVKRRESDFRYHFREAHKGRRLRSFNFLNRKFSCDICLKEFKIHKSLKEHLEVHENQFNCEECDVGYKKVLDYVLHMRVHSPNEVFTCIFCDFQTGSIKDVTEHVNANHDNPAKYICQKCNKGFYIHSWYVEHENIHTGAQPFKCDSCNRKFYYSRFLAAHKRAVHKNTVQNLPSIYECVICKKRYQHKNSLKLHMNVHTGNVTICDICGKTLTSPEKLKFHMRTHTGYKPYACSYCEKSFTKKPILVEHERVHTGEKPYECHYCHKAFTQRSSLVIHIRGHTGERPYVCHLCDKGFVARAMLNVHLKSCRGFAAAAYRNV